MRSLLKITKKIYFSRFFSIYTEKADTKKNTQRKKNIKNPHNTSFLISKGVDIKLDTQRTQKRTFLQHLKSLRLILKFSFKSVFLSPGQPTRALLLNELLKRWHLLCFFFGISFLYAVLITLLHICFRKLCFRFYLITSVL